MRCTLTIVLVALFASVGAAQTSSGPSTPEPKTGRKDFDDKGPSSAGGLGGVRAKTNTRRLYVGGFPRIALPSSPSAPGHPRTRPTLLRTPDQGPIGSRSPDLIHGKPQIDLINRDKLNTTDPLMQPDRAPLQVLQQPKRFEPSRLINCRPNSCADRRYQSPDRPVVVRTSEGMFRSDDRLRQGSRSDRASKESEDLAPPPDPSTTELGNLKLVGQRPEAAISQIQAYLSTYPDDFHAMRLLSLALLANRNVTEAAAAMGRAYAQDPLLAKDAIVPEELGLDGAKMAAMAQTAQANASKLGSNAWLMVLVLQQGQSQTTQALATLEKAKRSQMSPEVADRFAASLAVKVQRASK